MPGIVLGPEEDMVIERNKVPELIKFIFRHQVQKMMVNGMARR